MIHTYCIGKAHELIVKEIYSKGYERITTNGEKTLEIDGSCIVIDNPLTEPMVSVRAPFGKLFAEQYAEQILHGTKADFDYTYHDRLYKWSTCFEPYLAINQVQCIIDELFDSPKSRRAVATLWIPSEDIKEENVPCLNLLQCKIVGDKLNMDVIFRSNDMCSAFGQNAYGLVQLQKHIADSLGLPVGRYQHISLIPHIYIARDKNDIERLIGVE